MKNEELRRVIDEQRKGKETMPEYMVGEQLLEIADREPEAAEILLQDLKTPGMALTNAAAKLKEYADSHHAGKNCFCITPTVADGILRDFYGLRKPEDTEVPEDKAEETEIGGIDLLSIF